MAADVALVVVTYNSAAVIGTLVASLPAALEGLRAEVVVVDNDSTDQTVEVVARHPGCQVLRRPNLGYAAGLNAGLEITEAPAVLLLNPDLVLGAGSVAPLMARLEQPDVGVVAPRVLESDGSLHRSLRREPTLARALGLGATRRPVFSEYVDDPEAYEHAHPVDWALGAALLISRRCLEVTGGWDPSYFLYSEETDFCLRARDLGLATWYEPASVVVHAGGGSGQSDTTHAMQILNRVRLYSRRHGSFASYLYLGLSVLSELSWVVRGHDRSRAAVRALLDPRRRPPALGLSGRLLPR